MRGADECRLVCFACVNCQLFFCLVRSLAFVCLFRLCCHSPCPAADDAFINALPCPYPLSPTTPLAAKDKNASQKKGKGRPKRHGGVREEIRELQEILGVDDPDKTPQVCPWFWFWCWFDLFINCCCCCCSLLLFLLLLLLLLFLLLFIIVVYCCC